MSDADLLAQSLTNTGKGFWFAWVWLSEQEKAHYEALKLSKSTLTTLVILAAQIVSNVNGVADALAAGELLTGNMDKAAVIKIPNRL